MVCDIFSKLGADAGMPFAGRAKGLCPLDSRASAAGAKGASPSGLPPPLRRGKKPCSPFLFHRMIF